MKEKILPFFERRRHMEGLLDLGSKQEVTKVALFIENILIA